MEIRPPAKGDIQEEQHHRSQEQPPVRQLEANGQNSGRGSHATGAEIALSAFKNSSFEEFKGSKKNKTKSALIPGGEPVPDKAKGRGRRFLSKVKGALSDPPHIQQTPTTVAEIPSAKPLVTEALSRSAVTDDTRSVATPVQVVSHRNPVDGIFVWVNHVKQSAADSTVTGRIKDVLVFAEQFVKHCYRNVQVADSVPFFHLEAVNRSPIISTEDLQRELSQADFQIPFIIHTLVTLLLGVTSYESPQDVSLLPSEFHLYAHLARARAQSTTMPNQTKYLQQKYSSFRVLTADIRSDVEDDQNYLDGRAAIVDNLVSQFERAFQPWERSEHSAKRPLMLRKIFNDAASMGIFLFSQPSVFLFNWDEDEEENGFPVWPRLLRVWDDQGKKRQIADHMLAMKVVPIYAAASDPSMQAAASFRDLPPDGPEIIAKPTVTSFSDEYLATRFAELPADSGAHALDLEAREINSPRLPPLARSYSNQEPLDIYQAGSSLPFSELDSQGPGFKTGHAESTPMYRSYDRGYLANVTPAPAQAPQTLTRQWNNLNSGKELQRKQIPVNSRNINGQYNENFSGTALPSPTNPSQPTMVRHTIKGDNDPNKKVQYYYYHCYPSPRFEPDFGRKTKQQPPQSQNMATPRTSSEWSEQAHTLATQSNNQQQQHHTRNMTGSAGPHVQHHARPEPISNENNDGAYSYQQKRPSTLYAPDGREEESPSRRYQPKSRDDSDIAVSESRNSNVLRKFPPVRSQTSLDPSLSLSLSSSSSTTAVGRFEQRSQQMRRRQPPTSNRNLWRRFYNHFEGPRSELTFVDDGNDDRHRYRDGYQRRDGGGGGGGGSRPSSSMSTHRELRRTGSRSSSRAVR